MLLGDVPGHPARTVRGQLRMLVRRRRGARVPRRRTCSKSSASPACADERLGTLSLGMDRRLGLASALLGDPHTLVLDDPAEGLSPAGEPTGCTACCAPTPPRAARSCSPPATPRRPPAPPTASSPSTQGRLVADQDGRRLRPHPAAPPRRRPHPARRPAGRRPRRGGPRGAASVEVVARRQRPKRQRHRLSVYGSTAPRSARPPSGTASSSTNSPTRPGTRDPSGRRGVPRTSPASTASPDEPRHCRRIGCGRTVRRAAAARIRRRARPASPLRPLRYELRRAARCRHRPAHRRRRARRLAPRSPSSWPGSAAHAAAAPAGRLAARAAAAARRPRRRAARAPSPSATSSATPRSPRTAAPCPRRLGLLAAKLVVARPATALLLGAVVRRLRRRAAAASSTAGARSAFPATGSSLSASWVGLAVGCAWAGRAGRRRLPVHRRRARRGARRAGPRRTAGAEGAGRAVRAVGRRTSRRGCANWPGCSGRSAADRLAGWPRCGSLAQPVGGALMLSLTALLCAYRAHEPARAGPVGDRPRSLDRSPCAHNSREERPFLSDKASIARW